MAKAQLEMGGKNPMVVLDDADLDAVECAVQSAFYSTRCTASSRIIVEQGVYARFLQKLRDRAASLRIGHALEAGTDIGPVASRDQLEQNLRYVDIGRQEGARLLCGGGELQLGTPGHYMAPAIFADCDNAMRICREEILAGRGGHAGTRLRTRAGPCQRHGIRPCQRHLFNVPEARAALRGMRRPAW